MDDATDGWQCWRYQAFGQGMAQVSWIQAEATLMGSMMVLNASSI
jgi:hypothetical protein